MFIANKDVLRSIVKLSSNLKEDTILNRRDDVIASDLLEIFGLDFISTIEGFENSADAKKALMFTYINRFVAKRAVSAHVLSNELDISEAGPNRVETANIKTAYASQIKRLVNSLDNEAYKLLDSAISLCYSEEFAGFEETPIFTENADLFFNSSKDFTKHVRLFNGALTYYQILPHVRSVHHQYVFPKFAPQVIDAIKAAANTVTVRSLWRIQNALALFAVNAAVRSNQVMLTSNGVKFIGAANETSFENEVMPDKQAMAFQLKTNDEKAQKLLELVWEDVKENYAAFGYLTPWYTAPDSPKNFVV